MLSEADIEIRRLSTLSFEESARLWNEGFRGYFFDMTLSLDAFLARLQLEGISTELSLAAFVEDRAVGFVANSIRMNGDVKAAWNAGTGVAPEYRGRGVGRALMKATLELYRRHGVQTATLEAIKANEKAISLYRRFGYEPVDELLLLEHDGRLDLKAFGVSNRENVSYHIRRGAPFDVNRLSFYRSASAWQTLWQSVYQHNGESLVVHDASGLEAGYALFKRKFDEHGRLSGIILYQCEAAPGRTDSDTLITLALKEIFSPLDADCRRVTHNLRKSNETAHRILLDTGFKVYVEQVQMTRTFPGL
ncbi:MAG TPA: GNAT family N-acetyltransferase [Pyrinomonadaceae bacterium]|jgi:ribosomal protein S18 acetylase RimI-like enzyme